MSVEIRPLGRPGDLGWVVMAHGELYAQEFGWDRTFEALVARIVADYAATSDPGRSAAWIADLDGARVGCVFCVPADDETAQLRILLVDPAARGHGLGGRLVDQCLAFARAAGYRRMKLWTNHPLVAARHIYLSRGFQLIEQNKHHSFGVDLIGQVYELRLQPRAVERSRSLRENGLANLLPETATGHFERGESRPEIDAQYVSHDATTNPAIMLEPPHEPHTAPSNHQSAGQHRGSEPQTTQHGEG
jgi:GNAT superfamily N-acetyltransferase